VVVAHSASGLLLPLVPSFRPVTHLVYLAAAGVPQLGMTLDEQLAADPDMLNPAWVGVDPFQDHQAARRFLFHDCDEPTARWAIATQTPWYPEGLYQERCPLVVFPSVPSTSIVHRRPGHPAGLATAGRHRPAARPGGRAAWWSLPACVPSGGAGRRLDRDHRTVTNRSAPMACGPNVDQPQRRRAMRREWIRRFCG
jgi:hypothetical protein